MTRAEFHNGLRILLNIDFPEFVEALGLDPESSEAASKWPDFAADPHGYFIRCDDPTCDALWSIVERRQTRGRAA